MDTNELPTDLRDRLCYLLEKKDWEQLINNLKPKNFVKDESNNIVERKVVAKLAEILTRPGLDLPHNVTITILKCLTNACISRHDLENKDSYMHKSMNLTILNYNFKLNYYNKTYEALSMDKFDELDDELFVAYLTNYPRMFFPYDGIAQWVINQLNVIHSCNDISPDQWDITRFCFAFLCNITAAINQGLPECISSPKLQEVIVKLFASDFDTPQKITSLRYICCFVHNIINIVDEYFTPDDLVHVTNGLLKADRLEITTAQDALLLLMNTPEFVHDAYAILSNELKLYSLEVFYQNLKHSVYHCADDDYVFFASNDTVEFFANLFKQKSDLILKTADNYMRDIEPVEITILLDILGVLTSTRNTDDIILKNDTSLLISTVYLLRALHMAGKEKDNYFTPIQKLSELVPNAQDTSENTETKNNIQDHPAFGFKAALIRLIGNLVYKHRQNQDMVRDINGIPLLLDCCNIDARNPLIVQWTILAIRNLCEGNTENQELIGSSQKIKFIDNEIIKEFGIKLNENEDGNSMGIVPLLPNNL